MPSLGNDLATIRKEKNLSLDDIHAATKIPKHVINSIEDDSIFSDMEKNATYIRSYVRGYAKALSIDDQEIIYALDKLEKGNYSGSLQKTDEGKKQAFQFDKKDEESAESETDEEETTVTDKKETADKEVDEGDDFSSEIVPEHSITGAPQASELSKPGIESPSVESVDWADMGRKFQPLASTKSKVWVSIILFFIVATGGVFFYMYYSNSGGMSTNQSNANTQENLQPTAATDSLQLNISPSGEDTNTLAENSESASLQNQELETLPDTLTLVVYAAYGKLEPVRVYTDIMDGINPYWIEQGQAVRYDFVNNINIRGQFSRMILLLNSHPIPNFREEFYNPDTRLLEINRTFFEDDPRWLQPAPDSLNIDAPPPTVIRERPTFN